MHRVPHTTIGEVWIIPKSHLNTPDPWLINPLPLIGIIIGNIGIMEEKMETTTVEWGIE